MSLNQDLGDGRLWPEDTVEYRIYTSSREMSELQHQALECNHIVRQLSRGHVWHYAPFSLRAIKGSTLPHLLGRTCFRDNIEDEWLILHLLFVLSGQFANFVISVEDSDGQFLLIEAAHVLDKWMVPEEIKNRVFIHKGHVHIIPKPRSPAEIGPFPVTTPTITHAVKLVRDEGVDTECSRAIHECIRRRLTCFMDTPLISLLHRSHCNLPSLATHILSSDAQLVSAACHALVDRTPADMVACRSMKHFSPRKYALVKSEVLFPKLLYSQLVQLRFSAPRNASHVLGPNTGMELRERDLGMKLTCGLEILLYQAQLMDSTGASQAEDCPEWTIFLENLNKRDYFQGEMEGSKKHSERMASAKEFFLGHFQGRYGGEEEEDEGELRNPLVAAGRRIASIIKDGKFNEEEVIQRAEFLVPADDDGWMNISEKELDALLQRRACPGISEQKPCTRGATPTSGVPSDVNYANVQSAVFGMKSFVDKVSAHSGAEFPWAGDDPASNSAVVFDADTFMNSLRSMLEVRSESKKDEDDSDDSLSISDDEGSSGLSPRKEEEEREMEELMTKMDDELSMTSIGKSFECLKKEEEEDDSEVCADQVDLKQVDVDFNLVKNLLDSYSSQAGAAGPATNILHSLGLHLNDCSETGT